MKIEKTHTFTVENITGEDFTVENAIYPEVHMKIDSQATISDMIQAFDCFLKAIGYLPPYGHYLDYVSDENRDNYYVVKEIQNFGEF